MWGGMSNQAYRDEWQSDTLVGREQEFAAFIQCRQDTVHSLKIINVYGTAGIGKSSLLDEYQLIAASKGDLCITMDGEGMVKTPEAVCHHILNTIDSAQHVDRSTAMITETTLQALNELAIHRPICMFIDGYEHMESLDHWLRNHFFKKLGNRILIVLAGRYQLSEGWLLSPHWRRLITFIPLADLDFEAVSHFAQSMYVSNTNAVQTIWRTSRGHPLTMSLMTFLLAQQHEGDYSNDPTSYDTLAYIVSQWLREVPGEHLRPLIEAACIMRRFNQESLSFLLEREMDAAEFYQIIRFSFIRKVDQGWAVHSLMRELINRELQARTPAHYEQLRAQALRYQYYRWIEVCNNGAESMQQEGIELMNYIGDPLIRAFMNWFELSPQHYETAQMKDKEELKRYVSDRLKHAKDSQIDMVDPRSNQRFSFTVTAQESRYTLLYIDFDVLFQLGYDVVRIMRNHSGEIVGFAVIIPINQETLPYLQQAPRSKAYFSGISEQMRARLAAPPHSRSGWFIETIDTADLGDVQQQTAMGALLHSLIFTGELLIESPAPTDYFNETHKSLGFSIVEHGNHYAYDENREAFTFIMDRQGERALNYIHHMLHMTGQAHLIVDDGTLGAPAHSNIDSNSESNNTGDEHKATMDNANTGNSDQPAPLSNVERIMNRSELTSREKDVALMLEKGCTNAEIAKSLYISEVTVKKHLRSMMDKFHASNRTQLLKELLK